jgi:hypothetical protein
LRRFTPATPTLPRFVRRHYYRHATPVYGCPAITATGANRNLRFVHAIIAIIAAAVNDIIVLIIISPGRSFHTVIKHYIAKT